MTDTTPQTSERVTNTEAGDATDAHKEPDNVQTDQPTPQATHIQALPLNNADIPPKTTDDVETPPDTSTKTASEGEPQHSSISRAPSDSAIPQDEDLPSKPIPGDSPMPSSSVVPNGEQPGPNDTAFDEQSGMQVATPTLSSNLALTHDPHDAERKPHSPSIPRPRPEAQDFDLDLLPRIPGLFRLLDLVSDRNIEKIIIDHDSMGAAMNMLRHGTYKTISKINFAALDGVSINPVGLYGSKSALTQTLVTLEAVDESIAEHLRQPINRNGQLSPYLRSGIYLFLPPVSASDSQKPSSVVIYIIYWPEDETWNDDAPPTVQKNRVTFMRYLTKLAQDIRPLVSEEHAAAFVWKYDDEKLRGTADSDSSTDDESDDDDRFVKFEVKKSGQEDEGVQQYPGFTVVHPSLGYCDPQSSRASLVPGETSQAFMVSHIHQEGLREKKFSRPVAGTWLRSELTKDHNVYLGTAINEESIQILFDHGAMRPEAIHIYHSYKGRRKDLEPKFLERKDAAISKLQPEWPTLKKHAELLVRRRFSEVYNTLHTVANQLTSESEDSLEYLIRRCSEAPKARNALDRYREQTVPRMIDHQEFKTLRDKFIDVAKSPHESVPFTEEEAQTVIDSVASSDESRVRSRRTTSGYGPVRRLASWGSAAVSAVTSVLSSSRSSSDPPKVSRSSFGRDDVGFLRALEQYNSQPASSDVVQAIKTAAAHWIESRIWDTSDDLAGTIQRALESFSAQEIFRLYCAEESSALMKDLSQALIPYPSQPYGVQLDYLQSSASSSKFLAKGSTFTSTPPFVEHFTTQLNSRREETDLLEHEPARIPALSPHRNPVLRTTPLSWRVLQVHLIDQGRRILHIIQSSRGIDIYLNDACDTEYRKSRKHFPSREDRSLFFAVDEQTCQLVVVHLDQQRSFLQAFSIEDHFEALQPRGPQFELTHLYNEGPPEIQDICFFSGSEGICLLEKSGKIRVFSPQTQAFWPGSIKVSPLPVMMKAAPDGSALLLVERIEDGVGWQLRVYHQATFGEKPEGKTLLLPPEFNDAIGQSFTVSSLGQRKHIYLIAHIPSTSRIISMALRISRKESHWSFRRKQAQSFEAQGLNTKHNSLVDCFAEVWERFPVIPAISREFTTSRPPLSLTFVTYSEHHDMDRIPHYFTAMTQDFTRQSHKPTGKHLSNIGVRMLLNRDMLWHHSALQPCKAGEWFVELISLIPIHIAVARDNCFLPYKDGISGEAIQQELLGTEVADIIDIITLGPYEAILGSYMATRPVRVVSSMGEQSVGKSFSLNHLVDTSFAGSAMRTTEGVWLSLCPTKDQVVIALDFEGVHSLERTAQEDMLLVLFNAAISNLIMFRNNFALNRNVANMFTSFQASARLFDPGNNPNLFKGLLTIIIKDVMDADKKEIVEEFGSKFNQIVNKEQGENFITVLHDNQLAVMPWDVIRSKEFYTRFSKLSKYLFKQQSTHVNAGEFLLTLKTLMAKLTAQDWGAIDQTLIRHRTSILQASLEQALISGQGDVGPFGELEGLKNYDTQQVLEADDTDAIFYLGTDEDGRQERLANLLARLGSDPARSNVDAVKSYLQEIGMQRIAHVKSWIDSNISRFMPTDNSDIKTLQRKLDELSTALLANIQLCSVTCKSCQLRCLRPKAHASGEHNCGTSHRCIETCTFCASAESGDTRTCGMQAGHDGAHICEAAAHVCGGLCQFNDKRGCQETCIKPVNHADEHVCAANLHQCGEPCRLQNIDLHNGRSFSCPNVCALPFDQYHDSHSCGEERSCPVRCELCPRYCAMGDHFHGLKPGAIHLCEQDHPCHETCQSPGVCEVEPKPESVETIYRGVHDEFSYTKFTQKARRLGCSIRIPQGHRVHQGMHTHTVDPTVTHFCEASCPQCGYICQLPYGHAQREHDTAHGSMQKTVWAIEDSGDATIKTEGHRFGAQESGAPHLCFMYCKHLGRHAHIDFCRNDPRYCQEADSEHAHERILPDADVPKDWISHRLFWTRTGFKDPYSRTDQAEFALCDHYCPGREHESSTGNFAGPSYCTLPIFHPPPIESGISEISQHVSNDGHRFNCPDPATLIPIFHVIFVLDRSSSMLGQDRQPLRDQPIARRIACHNNNRFGAVLSAFYQFLLERSSATHGISRRDAYSVIVFNSSTETQITHDMTSSVDQMVERLLGITPRGGTNFRQALIAARQVMEQSWSAERSPVVVFLSDGEGWSEREAMTELCDQAVTLGKALSFWSISFGPHSDVLQEMADIAKETATRAARGSGVPPIPCDFRTAINTVQLANAFSSIATSLRKTRASLINPTAPAYTRSGASSSALISL